MTARAVGTPAGDGCGKKEAEGYLREIGAARVLLRQDIDLGSKPMEKALWAGAVDNLGGAVLTWLTRTVDQWGNIASVGLAGGHELNTTVMPFILRGVALLGVDSVMAPRAPSGRAWRSSAPSRTTCRSGQGTGRARRAARE